jgi:phosphate transport system permease protein
VPLFAPPAYVTNLFAAGVILAIMILPFITAVSREVIRTVPSSQREAALGLGATRWETISTVVLRGAKSGIVGAVILALGRAIGETMAVVMVIGNNPNISSSLLQPGYTMPSLLANQFNESQDIPIQRSALIEIALILFVLTLAVNALARLLILLSARNVSPGGHAAAEHPAIDKIRAAAGRISRVAGIAAVALFFAWQVVADFRYHGVKAIIGPLELVLLTLAVIQGAKSLLRPTRHWVRWRKGVNASMQGVVTVCAFAACLMLGLLLGYVVAQGMRSVNVHFFTGDASGPPDDPTGGMKNGIIGTLVLVGLASGIGIPIGVMGGIYLAEYGSTRIGGLVRFSADVLNGIPSVVMGMFAYATFVLPLKHFSAAAGGAALGIMMIPTIVRTTEEMLRQVPQAMREASLGLGATRVRTIRSIVMPAARAGIITGIMLAIARIAGETAPLLFTAFGSDQVSTKLNEPISSMTMMIYRYATSAYPEWIQRAWAGALVLLSLVLVISLSARLLTRNRYALR